MLRQLRVFKSFDYNLMHVFFFLLQHQQKVETRTKVEKEMKATLKPYYKSRKITKDEYKHILRKCVPKVSKIENLINRLEICNAYDSWKFHFFINLR